MNPLEKNQTVFFRNKEVPKSKSKKIKKLKFIKRA